MRLLKPLLLCIAPCLIAASCHKDPSCVTTGGGPGGLGSISVVPTHLGQFISSGKVYIKYGTLDAPGDGRYDDSSTCSVINDTPRATFANLTSGIYYLYGVGVHNTALFNSNVKGATNYTMCTAQNVSVYLPTYNY